MPTAKEKEIQDKFWSALKSDMTMMLGLDGVEDGHARPMTAQLDGERGPIWFFTSRDNTIVEKLGSRRRVIARSPRSPRRATTFSRRSMEGCLSTTIRR